MTCRMIKMVYGGQLRSISISVEYGQTLAKWSTRIVLAKITLGSWPILNTLQCQSYCLRHRPSSLLIASWEKPRPEIRSHALESLRQVRRIHEMARSATPAAKRFLDSIACRLLASHRSYPLADLDPKRRSLTTPQRMHAILGSCRQWHTRTTGSICWCHG